MANELSQTMNDLINEVYQTSPQRAYLKEHGYTYIVIRQGVLLDDELWFHPDTINAYKNGKPNTKYIFTFKSVYVNANSSTHTYRRSKKLSKANIKLLESVGIL